MPRDSGKIPTAEYQFSRFILLAWADVLENTHESAIAGRIEPATIRTPTLLLGGLLNHLLPSSGVRLVATTEWNDIFDHLQAGNISNYPA